MRRNRITVLILTIILYFTSSYIWGQSYVVTGNVWEINSGKKPVYDISIKFADAEEVKSGLDGSFEVKFHEKGIGDSVYLEYVYKEKWKYIYDKELETIIIPPDSQLSIDIFVAFESKLNHRQINFYNVSKKILLLRLEEIQSSLQNKLKAGDISLGVYQDSLSTIQHIFEAQNWRLGKITEELARLNSDQLPIPVAEALSLFELGKIREAINNLISYTSFIEASSDTQYKLPEYLQSIELLSQLWSLYLAPQKGVHLYTRLLDQNPEYLELILRTAAYFHHSGDYDHAKMYYVKGLANPNITPTQKTNIFLILGDILNTTKNISEALGYYQLASGGAKKLFRSTPNITHKHSLSQSYLKLAQTYTHWSLNNPDSTLHYILSHTKLSEELSEDYAFNTESQYELTVAYELLGISYQFIGQLDSAFSYFKKGQTLFEELCKQYPKNGLYKLGLSSAYEMMGETQRQKGDLAAAIKSHKQSRIVREELKKASPTNEVIEDYLAKSETQIAKLYLKLGERDSAMSCFQKALDIRKTIDKQYPGDRMLKSKLAIAYYDLGLSYFYFDYSSPKAKEYFNTALDIMRGLLNQFPHNAHFQEQELLLRKALNELE